MLFTLENVWVRGHLPRRCRTVGVLLSSAFAVAVVTKLKHALLSILQKMVCHGEHTYLFAQALMSVLAQEEQGGSAVRRIAQEVQRFAQER